MARYLGKSGQWYSARCYAALFDDTVDREEGPCSRVATSEMLAASLDAPHELVATSAGSVSRETGLDSGERASVDSGERASVSTTELCLTFGREPSDCHVGPHGVDTTPARRLAACPKAKAMEEMGSSCSSPKRVRSAGLSSLPVGTSYEVDIPSTCRADPRVSADCADVGVQEVGAGIFPMSSLETLNMKGVPLDRREVSQRASDLRRSLTDRGEVKRVDFEELATGIDQAEQTVHRYMGNTLRPRTSGRSEKDTACFMWL